MSAPDPAPWDEAAEYQDAASFRSNPETQNVPATSENTTNDRGLAILAETAGFICALVFLWFVWPPLVWLGLSVLLIVWANARSAS